MNSIDVTALADPDLHLIFNFLNDINFYTDPLKSNFNKLWKSILIIREVLTNLT